MVFHNSGLTPPHRQSGISTACRPVHSQVRQLPKEHSHHGHFIDLRPVGSAAFLAGFAGLQPHAAALGRLHRASDGQRFRLRRQSEYQGERFGALPPHSALPAISSPGALALQCLIFSIRNESHQCQASNPGYRRTRCVGASWRRRSCTRQRWYRTSAVRCRSGPRPRSWDRRP